jgi:hypothetical protein
MTFLYIGCLVSQCVGFINFGFGFSKGTFLYIGCLVSQCVGFINFGFGFSKETFFVFYSLDVCFYMEMQFMGMHSSFGIIFSGLSRIYCFY